MKRFQSFFNRAAQQMPAAETDEPASDTPPNPGKQVAEALRALLQTGAYREYETLWREAGFSVTPDYSTLEPPPDTLQFKAISEAGANENFLPNFFLLGAAKSGTSTLHRYLRSSPFICMSRPKEPFFFEAEYHLGLEFYRKRYFSHWQGQQIIGEARHRNLYLPYVPKRIAELNPQAKLLVILRNPVERAYSHWWYWHARGADPLNLRDALAEDRQRIERGFRLETPVEIDRYRQALSKDGKGIYRTYLDSGYYADQLQRYYALFPTEQIKVLLLDDLEQTPYATIHEIETYLGAPYYTEAEFEALHVNAHVEQQAAGAVYGQADPEVVAWLIEHYKPHNARLEQIVRRDLSHWNRFTLQPSG